MNTQPPDLDSLLASVVTLAHEEDARARDEYRALVGRLARGEHTAADTRERIATVLQAVGKTAEALRAEVAQLSQLVALAAEGRTLEERRAADREAVTQIKAAQAEYERVVADAKAQLTAVERTRDETSRAYYAAAQARDSLLDPLGLWPIHQAALRAVSDAERRGEPDEVAARVLDVAAVWERALSLVDFNPFQRDDEELSTAGPIRVEGCEWKTRDSLDSP